MLEEYGITVERTPVQGIAWRVTSIEKLPGHINQGRHAVYINAYNADGMRAHNVFAEATIENSDSPVIVPLDKPDSTMEQGHGNHPMFNGGKYSVSIRTGLMASDKVHGLHTMHPDEEHGNTWGHHSFRITFQRTRAETTTPPPPEENPSVTIEQRLSEVEKQLSALAFSYAKTVQHLRSLP